MTCHDSAAPSADAQRVLIKTLLALADSGAKVIAMAGNHDSPGMLDAYRPLAEHADITLIGQPAPPTAVASSPSLPEVPGGNRQRGRTAILSQRWAIRAADLLTQQTSGRSRQQLRPANPGIARPLKTGFTADAVNFVMAHLTVSGVVHGGGERAPTIFEYWVPASAFGTEPHYVALGHLHRRQTLPASCPVAYCGSPICVVFGEQDNPQ